MRTWRNWQTRKIQVLMVARLCRFKSCCPHQTRIKRTETIRFVFHILVCDRTCDNAVHCLHTPCAPARCAADASLTRINSPVSLLRSFYSLQVLLSAPKKTIRKGCLFHAAADLKQNYVLSANGTAFVCPCTQQTWLTKECID